jgi:hypothetical protein
MISCVFLFINCSKDSYEPIDGHSGIDKNKISFKQFKNETTLSSVEPLLQINSPTVATGKTKTQLSEFFIDTLAIKKLVSQNQLTTYSFRIYPITKIRNPNEIYNLVYRRVNGNWEKSVFYLLKKQTPSEDQKLFEKIQHIYDSKSTTNKTYKTTSLWECAIETPMKHCTLTGRCKIEGVCDNCSSCVSTVISYTNCSSGGSDGGNTSDPGTGGTFSSGGGTADPYAFDPNLFDNPVYDDPNYINAIKRFHVWTNLGDARQGFFASSQVNMNFFNETIQYQIINTWSPTSYVFAQEMRIRKFDYPIIFNSVTPFLIEKNIDDTQLNPCLKGIMEQLKMATNSDIANVMAKLDATNEYNLTMKMGTMTRPINYAETIKVSKNNYQTTVTQDTYTSASKLYRATILLHETIHAYMLSVVDDYNTYPTNTPFTDFPELFKIYVSKINKVDNAEIAQHEDMANKYVDAIASALEEYQVNTPPLLSSLADKQVFLDMAWSGLQNTDVFDAKFPLGSANRTRILARISAELNGIYSQGQYAVGQPCN